MSQSRFVRILLVLAATTVAAAAIAWRWFPEAQPTIALDNRLTPATATERAREFLVTRGFSLPGDVRTAVRFEQYGEWQTYLELEAGGKPAVQREVEEGVVPLFEWWVRFFVPGDPREYRVGFAPDGRLVDFRRVLAESDERPEADSTVALALAESVRDEWLGYAQQPWRLVASSREIVPGSERVDRTFTFERTDRRFGDAPIRLDVVIQGDAPGRGRLYADIPEAFTRRYAEMRASNELYAQLASLFVPLFGLLGILALAKGHRERAVRWRPALVFAAVMGLAMGAAGINALGLSWFDFDTATDPTTHTLQYLLLNGIGGAVGLGAIALILLAAGELVTRRAFPQQFDWWRTGTDAAARPVAARILGGYPLAVGGLAYVSLFYVVTQRLLGWWSPTYLLDDPNLIATPFPWLSAVAISLQAGVLEEVLFRAIPLAVLAQWVGNRRGRPWYMAGGVVVTALVFSFAHANYPSWPAYARGVELFAESAFWAVLFLRVGLPTTVIGHFLYDLILFGLFAAGGSDTPYRVTLAVLVALALLPALWVAWRMARAGGAQEATDEARFGAWQPPAAPEATAPTTAPVAATRLSDASRRRAYVIGAVGIALGLAAATRTPRGPAVTVDRDTAIAVAESLLVANGAEPSRWRTLTAVTRDDFGRTRRFLRARDAAEATRDSLGAVWYPPGEWRVRFVRTEGDVAERAESWAVALRGDGRLLGWRHTVPDTATIAEAPREVSRAAAVWALAALGLPADALREVDADEDRRPNRLNVRFRFDDLRVPMPDGAAARWVVTVSGGTVLSVGRSVHLPEEWERADTAFAQRLALVIGFVALLLVGVLVGNAVATMRTPVVREDAALWGRHGWTLIASVGAVEIALFFNGWPGVLASYDTAEPWSTFVLTSRLGALGAGFGVLIVGGLLALGEAARRRIGVPTLAGRTASAVAGVAIGGTIAGLVGVRRLLAVHPPDGELSVVNNVIPLASQLSVAWADPAAFVMVAGLVALAARRRWSAAVVLVCAAVLLGSGGALSWATYASGVAVTLGLLAIALVAIVPFVHVAASAWVVAGVVHALVGASVGVLAAPSPADRAAFAAAGLVLALVAVLWWRRLPADE